MIRPSSKEADIRIAAALLGDFAIAWGIVTLLVYIRRSIPLAFTRSLLPPENLVLTPAMVLLFAGSFIVALGLSGFYRQRITPRTRPVLLAALFIQLAIVSLGSTALAQPLPRTIVFAVPVLEALLLPLWRRLLRGALPVRSRATVLVGDAADIDDAVTSLRDSLDARVRIVACATPAELVNPSIRAVVRQAEEVILVSPDGDPRRRLELLRIRGPRGYLLLASHADALLTSSVFGWIGDQPLVEIAVGCGYGVSAAIKRGIDIVVSALLIILSSPLWLAATVAIWLEDRGPLTYRQERVGRDGVPFEMWKFRSMRDERVTRVGALLRRYRVDELPQLLNVLVGDMSLVGPRPERPQNVARILTEVPDFDLRSLVRPGIAGLAQVSSEYETHPEVKLRYDLTYMCDWSLWLDLRLLVRSVSTSLSGSGI
ncbi:MAG TPA: sugar transferase [Thermoanaerobaculia bacterium]|jgi:lipopolysaccharide/colanic/teichoic acid biosynthesis glycosyltransferase|nr:sugar transferase [Thermoanaerobaculia bacterium]